MDPNQVMEGGRPNIHAVNQLDLLDEEWLSVSPQRDDLKLLCEQNVSWMSADTRKMLGFHYLALSVCMPMSHWVKHLTLPLLD